jgi:hypothetical protein
MRWSFCPITPSPMSWGGGGGAGIEERVGQHYSGRTHGFFIRMSSSPSVCEIGKSSSPCICEIGMSIF